MHVQHVSRAGLEFNGGLSFVLLSIYWYLLGGNIVSMFEKHPSTPSHSYICTPESVLGILNAHRNFFYESSISIPRKRKKKKTPGPECSHGNNDRTRHLFYFLRPSVPFLIFFRILDSISFS